MGLLQQLANQPLLLMEVDPGIDDAVALMVVFGAWKLGLIQILAVICSNGNANITQTCENTKKIMDAAHIREGEIPLFRGVATAIVEDIPKDYYFGRDGLGDIKPEIKSKVRTIFPASHLSEYIESIARVYNEAITYLSLGSLTFLMSLLIQQPNYKFKDIWIMGGNNLDVDFQEWNFHVDPEAAHFVLRQSSRIPLYIGTFQNCENIKPTVGWRRNVLGKINTDFIHFINKAEASKLTVKKDTDIWLQYDPIVAVAFVFQNSITKLDDIMVNVTLGTNPKTRSVLVKGDFKMKSIHLDLQVYKNALEKTAKALA